MRITLNKKYTTISIYAVIVFLICLFFFKVTDSWTNTKTFFSGALSILSPFLLGMLIAYFMNFLVVFFENHIFSKLQYKNRPIKRKKARFLSLLFAYLILFNLVLLLLAIIIPQLVSSMIEFANEFEPDLKHFLTFLDDFTFTFNGDIYYLDVEYINETFMANLPNTFNQWTGTLSNLIPNLINITKNLAFGLLNILISIIISIYLIADKETSARKLKKLIIALFPTKTAKSILETATFSHRVFSNFFIGKLVDSLIIGIICFVLLLIFKIPFPLLISILVGITNIIPYFGPFIGGGIGFVFLVFVSPVQALWFVVLIIVLQQFDGNILGPKILGDSIGLSPFWIIFSIVLFGSMFGFIGMLLGAPFFSVIKTLFEKFIDKKYNKRLVDASNVEVIDNETTHE